MARPVLRFPHILVLTACLLLSACDEGDSDDATDTASDTASDSATLDTSDDAPTDTTTDASTDSDDGGVDTTDDAQDAQVDTPSDMASTCDRNGFDLMAQVAEGEAGFLSYSGANATAVPFDQLSIELLDLPRMPFTFEFDDENYKTCDTCVRINAACDGMGPCTQIFLVESGTLEVTAWEEVGGNFAGSLTNLVAREVTIAEDFTSAPVENGEVWCVDRVDFDAVLDPL